MRKYILFAGVNGAGKSTLYHTTKYKDTMPRINVDELIKSLGNWNDTTSMMTAGKLAIKKLNQYMKEGISFNQETTLCGNTIFKNIQRAKELGYIIEMHYIGLDSVELAKERVSKRVTLGGHGISDEDIERRYENSFMNLTELIPVCDLVCLYDNTNEFRRFAIYKKGDLIRLSNKIPNWYKERFLG